MATAPDTAASHGVVDPPAHLGGDVGLGDLAVGRWDPGVEEPSKSDRYLARRLAAASADYKSVACTTFVLGVAVAGGGWLAAGILAEHWLVPGGLSATVRWAWLGVALAALVAAAVRWLVPLARYRVNLVYAARAIEREHPELHNDLVNTVLVKAHRESNPEKVVRSLERRTAKQLAEVPVEAVIDRTVPLRLAWVLAALVGLAGLYELAAPKSLLVSAARLLAPWVGWAAPSRVRIEAPRLAWRLPAEPGQAVDAFDRRGLGVDSGSATLVRGRQLVVAADIRGLRRGERPEVVVAPLRADGAVDTAALRWSAELVRGQSKGGERTFVALLPDATRGLDHSIEITIAAGDARSAPVRVSVVDSPTLLVREIRYAFPDYTRRAPETVEWQGDIRALEGTEVTVVAESNQPLADAWIDFDADGGRDLKFVKSAADHARVTKMFQLRLKAGGTGPEHASYRLLFQPLSMAAVGREEVITDPLQHRIEVLADVAPEVAIDEPRESPLRVPPTAPVTVRVQAHDPDFALARVAIETRLQGGAAGPEIAVLEKEHTGVFRGAAQLVPERLGAGPGAVLEYRAVAIDNRPKQPNVSHSPWQALRIDPSAPSRRPEPPPTGRQPANGDPSQGQAGERGGQGRDDNDAAKQPADQRRPGEQQKQDHERQQHEQPQAGTEKQQGKQDGQAEGAQGGDRQQQPDKGAQAGNQQGEGRNQGQGAERGQGLGAEGERQGGAEQQAGKQQQDGGNDRGQQGGQRDGQPQAGQQRGNDGKQPGGVRDNSVAADGTNDGEAMERILDHRREQGEKQDGNGGAKQDEQQGEGAKQQRDRTEPGESGEQPDGDHKHASCNRADGKPCGKEGCPTCKGQGGGGQAGDEEKKAGGDSNDESGAGGAAGDKGAGTDGTGQKGAGKEGAGQATSKAGAGKEGGGKEGGGKEGGGKEGGGKEGGGKEGGGKEGGGKEGGGKEGAAGDGQQAAETTQTPQEASGQQAQDQRAGSEPGAKPGAKPGDGEKRADAGDKAAPQPGEPGSGAGQTGSGGWAGGDATRPPDAAQTPDGLAPTKETEWGEQDLAHARNAASLALEHLRKAVESGDTDVLDRLGWTRDQARAFLERWEKMRVLAESADPIERGAFERTMRSLGLRPEGVRSSRDVPADARGGQAEGRRSRPPADYEEQVRAYTQGTSEE